MQLITGVMFISWYEKTARDYREDEYLFWSEGHKGLGKLMVFIRDSFLYYWKPLANIKLVLNCVLQCLKLYLLVRALSWEGLVFFSIPTIPFPMPDLLINSRTLPLCFIFSYLYDYSEFFKHRFCFLPFPHNTAIFAHSKHLLLRFVLLLYFGLTF